jgi:hypothetical protein
MLNRLIDKLIAWAEAREPSIYIGGPADPYLIRWTLLPRNPIFNVYLHKFMRSDDDRALHDHPWCSMSVLIRGRYREHTIAKGGIHKRREYGTGSVIFRLGGNAHRVEVDEPVWTLFFIGPRYRDWGFHCPEQGWIHWQAFTVPGDEGSIGLGCEAGAHIKSGDYAPHSAWKGYKTSQSIARPAPPLEIDWTAGGTRTVDCKMGCECSVCKAAVRG